MRDINTLHPTVKQKAQEFKTLAKEKLGLNIIITECLRTAAEQAALYSQGRQTLAGTNALRALAKMAPISLAQSKFTVTKAATIANSFHGYGLAFDIAVTDPTGKTIDWNHADWNKDGQEDWHQLGALGVSLGLEWGGQWTSYPDMPHYQCTMGRTIANLKADKTVVAGATINMALPLQYQQVQLAAKPDATNIAAATTEPVSVVASVTESITQHVVRATATAATAQPHEGFFAALKRLFA